MLKEPMNLFKKKKKKSMIKNVTKKKFSDKERQLFSYRNITQRLKKGFINSSIKGDVKRS